MDILEHGGCVFIVGSLGGGKTMGAVRLAQQFLDQGRPIATNIDLHMPHMRPMSDKSSNIIRLPDYPKLDDFYAAGYGSETPKNRNTHGLLLLDECGTWLNSRDAMDKSVKRDRLDTIKLFLDIRKRGWVVAFIVQDEELVDKQIRTVMMQFRIEMKNTEHMPIPVFGMIAKLFTGKVLTLPKRHLGIVRYVPNKLQMVDWWWFEGKPFYKMYDTEQEFDPHYDQPTYSVLTNWVRGGRYLPESKSIDERFVSMFKSYSREFLLTVGILFGVGVFAATLPPPVQIVIDTPVDAKETLDLPQVKDKPLPEIDFTEFYVESHYKFGKKAFMTIANSEDPNAQRYTTDELKSMGFGVAMLRECHLLINNSQTEITHEIFCKKPEVKYLDPYDFSHLPTGESISG